MHRNCSSCPGLERRAWRHDDPGSRGRPVVLALLQRKSRKWRSRIHTIARRWLNSHPPDTTVAKALDAF
jgi:hypothetical protein